jgi:hypothetical protein
MIFLFDPARMELDYFPVTSLDSFSFVTTRVLAGDDKWAFAIADNRRLLLNYPDLLPFECATFDLVAKTGYKADFVPIEDALKAAGFNMSEIQFRPNSIGRIIATDWHQAALLEISDL